MSNRIAERIRLGHLTHAGVDHLERVLEELGITLDAEQQARLRDAVGPSCDRELEAAVDEILYPSKVSSSLSGMDAIREFLDEQNKT